jgi:hypothetical protein
LRQGARQRQNLPALVAAIQKEHRALLAAEAGELVLETRLHSQEFVLHPASEPRQLEPVDVDGGKSHPGEQEGDLERRRRADAGTQRQIARHGGVEATHLVPGGRQRPGDARRVVDPFPRAATPTVTRSLDDRT